MPLTDQAFQRTVTERLLQLNYHAFLQVIVVLLKRMGYQDVRLLSRTGYVGRNRTGGVDLVAYRLVPGGRRLIAVQVKQYAPDRAIFTRTLDELRGVCLRTGAAEAMLITTSTFSESVRPAGYAAAPIAPIRLLDGVGLAELLSLYRVGISWSRSKSTRSGDVFRLNEPFFTEMEATFPGVARPEPGTRRMLGVLVAISARKRRG